jgi:hypothetical protein
MLAICKQEMVGWLVGGVNTWHEFGRISSPGARRLHQAGRIIVSG